MEESEPIYTQVGSLTTPDVWSANHSESSHCRICGNVNEYLIPIFSGEGIEHQLEYKINRLLPLKVSATDHLSNHVCYTCASTIIAFHALVDNCQQVQAKLNSYLHCEDIEKEKPIITDTLEEASISRCEIANEEVVRNSSDTLAKDPEVKSGEVSEKSETVPRETRIPGNQELKDLKKPRKRKKRSLSTCLICGKVFNFLEYLKTHLLIHSENRPHLCHICGATFKRKDHVNHHRRTVHITHRDVIRELGAKGEEPLTCEICGDIKPTRHAMQVHKKKHNKICICDVCNKSFSLPSLLKEHMTKDHTEEVCTCNVCGDVLKSGHSLYLHKKKHSTSYICDVCGKSFSLPSSLRTHMVVHSDDKPFSCDECGKSFKLRGRLQLHKKNHGNIRPYACNICENKRFKTKSALIVHNNMHNDTRLYPCPHCSFRARKNSDLVCHIRTHTGEKPYKCDVCGRGFAQAGDMRKHKTTHDRHKVI